MAVIHVSPSPLSLIDSNSRFTENWGHTQSKLYKVNFAWTINNFSFFLPNSLIQSPSFCGGPKDELKWCLQLLNSSEEYISIFLKLMSEPLNKSKVLNKTKISIINTKSQQKIELKSREIHECQVSETRKFKNFIKKKVLFDETNGILINDTLKLLIEMDIVTERANYCFRKSVSQFKVPKSNVLDDLANLLDSQKFSDVTLLVGEDKFPAHKAILAARSVVFAAMFEHEMVETMSNRVTITDVRHDVLQEMLHFIYTGKAPNLNEMADHLFAAADKYALKELKVLSEIALFHKLSIERATEILILADLHSAQQLKDQTISFIKNHARDIIKTIGWQEMIKSQSPLVAEVLEVLVTPPQQDQPIQLWDP